jgi:DNA-directed RNA polymerase subunit RPC12/RpoP
MLTRKQDAELASTLIWRFCAPKPSAPASFWVEENVRFNEPKIRGAFSFSGREYLREIVDSWGPLPPGLKGGEHFIGCMGTGIGKTTGSIAGILYRLMNEPMRALIVKPTSHGPAGASSFTKTRLVTAIKSSRCFEDLIPTGAERHNISSSQISMNGCVIDITGSNSVGQLGENRCDVVLQDEIDKYPPQREESKEANAIILADERTKSVSDARRFKFSTPTLGNTGIWAEFLKGDQRRRFVPCPHCGKGIVFAWSRQFTVFEFKGYEAFVRWDDSARTSESKSKYGWDLEKVAETAHALCPHCQGRILDRHKPAMDAKGHWEPTAKGAPGYYSWHLPSMYALTADCSFGAMAKKFLIAKHSPDGVKGFINSDLAEPDVTQQIAVDRAGIVGRELEVTGEWVKLLSADYHQNAPYFWALVRAWNGSNKSHGVEYQSFNQWHELDELQAKHKIIPQAVIVDSGFDQAEVMRNCANFKIQTRCLLIDPVQDALPECNGWSPAKAFGGKRMYRDTVTNLYMPFRIKANCDPYAGTELAHQCRIELLEFLSDLFEDNLENIRLGKTFIEWSISKEMDSDEYHRHMAGKKRVYKKDGVQYQWATIRPGYADHLRSCELLNFVLAYRLQLISYEAIQTREKEKDKK